MNYGLQLYSVRDSAEKNFEEMLAGVAKMGYAFVESAGFFDRTAEQVKETLDRNGLTLCSTHTSFRRVRDELDETIAFHKAVGCKNIVIPGAPMGTAQELDELVDVINRAIPKIEAAGMKLHFHNHSREFIPNADGQIPQEELAKRTRVWFEIDTFWAFNAGKDPLAMLEKYADRISLVHLKDGIPQDWADQDSHAVGKSLGEGKAPVDAVRKKALEMGLTIVVESEGLDPCGMDEVQRCIQYLKQTEEKENHESDTK